MLSSVVEIGGTLGFVGSAVVGWEVCYEEVLVLLD